MYLTLHLESGAHSFLAPGQDINGSLLLTALFRAKCGGTSSNNHSLRESRSRDMSDPLYFEAVLFCQCLLDDHSWLGLKIMDKT